MHPRTARQMTMFRLPPVRAHVLTREQFNVLTYLILMAEIPATLFPARPNPRVLRLLISLRYVDVIQLKPARYRVTELGRSARSTFMTA